MNDIAGRGAGRPERASAGDDGATGLRTRMVGRLGRNDAGTRATLVGWVHRRRDLGGLVFLDLRDRSGLLQVSLGPEWTEGESLARAHKLGSEDVISVTGEVVLRPEASRNPEIATGDIEVRAVGLEVLNNAATPRSPSTVRLRMSFPTKSSASGIGIWT